MSDSSRRRFVEVGIWLLTPLVAWAVAFLGAWLGALAGQQLNSSTAGIGLLIAGGLAGAVAGGWGWIRWARRMVMRGRPEGKGPGDVEGA